MNKRNADPEDPEELTFFGHLCLKKVYLPNMSINGHSCLARLFLNKEQMQFIDNKKKHSLWKGGFGSGKSIIGMTKFKKLAHKATLSTFLYYICCSNDTMYTKLMKSRIHHMLEHCILPQEQIVVMNSDEYAETFNLSKPAMISDI